MNQLQEYIFNRMLQSQDSDKPWAQEQLLKWRILDRYTHGTTLSREEKLDFIRASLSNWAISDTTLDIVFRRMIRWTLPGWIGVEILGLPENNGYLHQRVHSKTRPGLAYTVTHNHCDCPGFRGNTHCKHHDDFTEELAAPSNLDENLTAADYEGAKA